MQSSSVKSEVGLLGIAAWNTYDKIPQFNHKLISAFTCGPQPMAAIFSSPGTSAQL
jgi:hypothetical protein